MGEPLDRSRVIDEKSHGHDPFPNTFNAMASPYMPRQEFLAKVGSFEETREASRKMQEHARAIWNEVRDEFYTKAGTIRNRPASFIALEKRRLSEATATEASRLLDRAYQQQQMWKDPWSHTRIDSLREWTGEYKDWKGPFQVFFI